MTKRDKAIKVKAFLDREYGLIATYLHYDRSKPYQLLFCIMLSAQTTDGAVNKVTPILFARYQTLKDLAKANEREVEAIIRPVGLAPTKARHLVKAAQMVLTDFKGQLPKDRKALMALPGVGYKTAGVYLGERYDFPYIPVDTHVAVVAQKLGFVAKGTSPERIERTLEKCFGGLGDLMNTHRQLIMFGRKVCHPSTTPKHCWDVIEGRSIKG